MRFFLFVSFLLCLSCLTPGNACAQTTEPSFKIYETFSDLETRLQQAGDAVLVVNFWATFCIPCVEELPYFEMLTKRYAGQNVQVLLVSLNFKSKLNEVFVPFLQKRDLQSEVALLADRYADEWIPRIDAAWDGAIPATLVLQGGKKAFHMSEFKNYLDLENFVQPFLNAVGIQPPSSSDATTLENLHSSEGMTGN